MRKLFAAPGRLWKSSNYSFLLQARNISVDNLGKYKKDPLFQRGNSADLAGSPSFSHQCVFHAQSAFLRFKNSRVHFHRKGRPPCYLDAERLIRACNARCAAYTSWQLMGSIMISLNTVSVSAALSAQPSVWKAVT